jgi:hypothetical protein
MGQCCANMEDKKQAVTVPEANQNEISKLEKESTENDFSGLVSSSNSMYQEVDYKVKYIKKTNPPNNK